MYTLYMAFVDGSNALKFPIPLEEVPQISRGATTDTFTTWDGQEFTFITGKKPCEFSINTWLPKDCVNYNFQVQKNINTSTYINFLKLVLEQKRPVKIVITAKSRMAYVNGSFVITDFTESKNKFGDTVLSISCKEWFKYDL